MIPGLQQGIRSCAGILCWMTHTAYEAPPTPFHADIVAKAATAPKIVPINSAVHAIILPPVSRHVSDTHLMTDLGVPSVGMRARMSGTVPVCTFLSRKKSLLVDDQRIAIKANRAIVTLRDPMA